MKDDRARPLEHLLSAKNKGLHGKEAFMALFAIANRHLDGTKHDLSPRPDSIRYCIPGGMNHVY